MMNNGKMPVRFKYPPTIQATNPENYKKAVALMGGDDINVKVWWEKIGRESLCGLENFRNINSTKCYEYLLESVIKPKCFFR